MHTYCTKQTPKLHTVYNFIILRRVLAAGRYYLQWIAVEGLEGYYEEMGHAFEETAWR